MDSFEQLEMAVSALIDSASHREAVELLTAHWPDYVSEHAGDLRGMILSLPEEVWDSSPWLLLALGSTYRSAKSANPFAALEYLDAADDLIEAGEADPPHLIVMAQVVRCSAYRALGRVVDSLGLSSLAQTTLASLHLPVRLRIELRSIALLHSGISKMLVDDLDGARSDLLHGLSLRGDNSNPALGTEALGCLALVEYYSGAAGAALPYVAAARDESIGTGLLRTADGAPVLIADLLIQLDRGNFAGAEKLLPDLAEASRGTEYEPFYLFSRAALKGARGYPFDQLELLQDMQMLLRDWQAPSLAQRLRDADRVHALIELGEMSSARDGLTHLSSDERHINCTASLAARLELAIGDFDAVLETTTDCRALADNHAPRSLAYVDLLRAAAHSGLGDTSTAAEAFDRALALASHSRWRRHFMKMPHDILAGLLEGAKKRDHSPETAEVIEELSHYTSAASASIVPLSSREQVVLSHILAGETQRQIATVLCVSPNTVKTQMRSIYRKLGAATRHEAVDRATKYGFGA